MFLGLAAIGCDHCVQKEGARGKIDNRRASDAHEIKLGADEIARCHRISHIPLPDDAPIEGVERIHVIRFGHCYNHRPAAWAILDVERLRIDVADNCAVKIQVAYQIGSGTRRESRVNVETVAGIMIVKLRNVHLCVRRKNCAQNSKAGSTNDERANANWRFHRWQSDSGGPPSTTTRGLPVKHRDEMKSKSTNHTNLRG